jgi:hypothetical protein
VGATINLLRQGGVLVAMEYLSVAGVVIALAWTWLDPGIGWITAVLSMPFVVYQLTPRLNSPGPDHPSHVLLVLIAAVVAFVTLSTTATTASRRL